MVHLENAQWPLLEILILSRNKIGLLNETQLTDEGCYHLSRMATRSMKNLGLFGNEISLNGIRMILRSGIHQPNCFLGTAPSTQNYSRTSSPTRRSDLTSRSTTSSATNFKIDRPSSSFQVYSGYVPLVLNDHL
jgi:hypothetical protein